MDNELNKVGYNSKSDTFQDVIDWFENKHQLYVEILIDRTTEPKYTYTINKFIGNPKDLTEKEWGWEHVVNSEYLYRNRTEFKNDIIKTLIKVVEFDLF